MGQLIAVNGVRLNVEMREPVTSESTLTSHSSLHPDGEREPPARSVVLLHGFAGSAAGWGARLDAIAASGHRAIAIDLLGHGQSDAPADPARYRVEHAARDIIAALRMIGHEPAECVLLGYSMGGRIALYTAFQARWSGLALESASPGLATEDERAARRASDEALADRIEHDGVPAFVDEWERLPLFASQVALSADVRAAVRAGRLANRALGLANSLRGASTGMQPSLWERLPALDLPVVLLAGALDAKFTGIARQMAAALPRARLAVVASAGHTIHLEQPAAFDAAVAEFAAKLV